MPDIKQRAHKMLKEILADINLNGVGFGNKDMAKYYRGGYLSAKNKIRRKLPSFIDEIIDMRDKEIVEMIDGLDRYNFAGELRADGVAIDIRDLKNKLSAEAR